MAKRTICHQFVRFILCLVAAVCLIVCTIPYNVRAASGSEKNQAASVIKTYIQSNGETAKNKAFKYIPKTLSEDEYINIEYSAQNDELTFYHCDRPGSLAIETSFIYNASSGTIKNNRGEISITFIDYGRLIVEGYANFNFSYRSGDRLKVNFSIGKESTLGGSITDRMTDSFKRSMKEWNDLIIEATGGKYNIGSLGFKNYIASIGNGNATAKPANQATASNNTKVPPAPSKPMTTSQYASMYRLYNKNSGEHFYTANNGERENLVKAGWADEGISWYAPKTSKTPVYRLYNPNTGDHHYTTKAGERDVLVKAGWKYEGIGWYSDDNQGTPIYRQYNPHAKKAGFHNYTPNKSENDMLVKAGWKAEGIGWYGLK